MRDALFPTDVPPCTPVVITSIAAAASHYISCGCGSTSVFLLLLLLLLMSDVSSPTCCLVRAVVGVEAGEPFAWVDELVRALFWFEFVSHKKAKDLELVELHAIISQCSSYYQSL
jgi:hypothetical protein